jgi:cation:H+ antiporter
MSSLWLPSAAILVGFIGLVWSADRFIDGSAALAKNLGLSKLLIGLTIVSVGTSAPEVVVSISSSLKNAGELAVGNALGSNLANIGLVLGITTMICKLPVRKYLLLLELPALFIVTAMAGIVLYDAKITFWEGLILLTGLVPLLFIIFKVQKYFPNIDDDIKIPHMDKWKATFWFLFGLSVLIISSEALVWGGTEVAEFFGVSPLIIGLTVIAVGTSLPELAASIVSAIKGHAEIALGNIIGSNIFNILTVLAVPGLISSKQLSPEIFTRDYLSVAGLTLLLIVIVIIDYFRCSQNGNSHGSIGRKVGVLLLLCYLSYYIYLINF